MCGIAGLFDIKGSRPYEASLLQEMTDVIAHRGPDGEGLHIEPGLALGHRRLAIIDLAGGAQPMRTVDRSLTIVFNGEIYNFLELRAELEAKGAQFVTRSDTEVLLHGWRAWRERLFERLNGMFALALYDARDETLVLARDRFGKKPLHYALLDDGGLVFGSEIKSLLRVPEISRELDPHAVADFFALGYVPDPKTIYRSIRKLPPAHLLIARRGRGTLLRRYWSLLDTLGTPDPGEEALAERLRSAVGRRLISDVPLGALLSGGVDSSAVVALMTEAGCRAPRTFSIAFAEREYDETRYAAQVAERYGADHEVRQLDPDDFSLIPRLPEIYDEPFGDVSAIPTFAVCAQARRFVTVALSGDGGDEALAGYRRYAFQLNEERLRGLVPAGLRRALFGTLADLYPQGSWLPRRLRAKAAFRELSLDPAEAWVRMASALHAPLRSQLFSGDFKRMLGGYDPGEVVRTAFNVDAPLDPLQRAQYADVQTYLPGDILTKVDRASMANSLELRSPMLDPEFFAWSFGLPAGRKIVGAGNGKAILKAAMESRLPRDLLYRPKQGFAVPLARWFRGPLREQVQALADSSALVDSGFVDRETVRRLAQGHQGGAQDNSKALWLVWVFDAFLAHSSATPQAVVAPGGSTARARPAQIEGVTAV
jgi:asparagine synthase (glutamine-hydrolysing)